MSSGERKKRSGGDHSKGWEEAGAEFYQESYPGATCEADLQQALQRDPSHIATLLPSKKSRVATTAKRVRHEPRTTLRRRTSTRSRYATNTARRMSANVTDATVSMLPDLSENLSNEESTWEEIMQIKAMPVSMSQKIELKKQLQSATKLRLQGYEHLKFERRKAWQNLQTWFKVAYSKLGLWNSSLKHISGQFGMGIVAYFLFVKWILFLNIFLFIIFAIFVILPTIFLELPSTNSCASSNATCCPELYFNSSRKIENIQDYFQSQGLFEFSLLFYGTYSSVTYYNADKSFYYNLPLAYICAMISIFIISLIAIVKSAAKGFRERVVESEGQFYKFCNLVFGGWDYCINNEKASSTKRKALYYEIKALLESERFEEERQNRTGEEKLKLFFIRVFVNVLVILILASSGFFIFYVIRVSFEHLSTQPIKIVYSNLDSETIHHVIFEFLPYICIVLLNLTVPVLFRHLISLENYSPPFVIKITLFRTIFLRIASLIVLLSSFYNKIVPNIKENECNNLKKPLCWETFVGQQFLKLYLTDLVGQFFQTFFINFPRSLVGRHTKSKFLRFVCQHEFDLPKNVLDIVYLQTICWLGVLFAPALPLFAALGSFILFYVKKFSCVINCRPPSKVYRASRSHSMFMFILLMCYIFAAIPVTFYVIKYTPSKVCGPFKGLDTSWSLVIETFLQLPEWLRSLVAFLSTATFGVPAFLILGLILYYYYTVTIANKNMVQVLKNQLILEGHDKQFLLDRLSAFIKQHQEQSKYNQEHSVFS